MIFTDGLYTFNSVGEIVPWLPNLNDLNVYSKSQVDQKDSNTLSSAQTYAKNYTDQELSKQIAEFSSTQWAALSTSQKASYKLAVVYQV